MGFIYLRGEYRYLLEITEKAVAQAYAKGFLGKNIFGSGIDFDIVTQTGAGAYEVGEESALMESLEGKRGIPRIKPPFPAVVGLYGGPTAVSYTHLDVYKRQSRARAARWATTSSPTAPPSPIASTCATPASPPSRPSNCLLYTSRCV